MPWEQTQISVSSGSCLQEHWNQDATQEAQQLTQSTDSRARLILLSCHPVRETMANQAKQGPGGLRGCCFYFLSIRLTFSSLRPSLFVHLLCHVLLLFYYSLASAFPFSASTSSCHKEPESSPERSLPALRCNPIIWQKSVSSPQSNRKSCAPDRSPRCVCPYLSHSHTRENRYTVFLPHFRDYLKKGSCRDHIRILVGIYRHTIKANENTASYLKN